jgi:hypothetical protein
LVTTGLELEYGVNLQLQRVSSALLSNTVSGIKQEWCMSEMNEEEKTIHALCKETFVSKSAGLGIIWVLAGILLSMAGTAVGFALTTSTEMTKSRSDISYIQSKQDKLDRDINRKLDILIDKK